MGETLTPQDEEPVIAYSVESTDLTFNGPNPEAGDVVEDPTWFDVIDAAVGK